MAVNFESTREIEKRRQDLRESRQIVLDKAREKYEKDEHRKEMAKQRGEGDWMLAAVNDRIISEQMSMKKAKSKKKKKEKKKKKQKEKKKKKKDSSSSSDTSDDDEAGPVWVEKSSRSESTQPQKTLVKGPMLQRDEWMSAPVDLFPTVTRKDLIEKKNKEKEEIQRQKDLLEKPGMHAKELNPYWKDGGTGVPDEEKKPSASMAAGIGDGGASWLRKAYQRCVEQAKEEGRTLEEVAADRYGSLKKLKKMIDEAERKENTSSRPNERPRSARPSFMKPSDDASGDPRRDGMGQARLGSRETSASKQSRNRSRSRSRERRRSRSRDRQRGSRSNDRERSRSRDRHRISRSSDRKRSRSKERKRRDRSSKDRSRSRERRRSTSRNRSRSRDRLKRSRSRSRDRHRERSSERTRSSGSGSVRGRFMKPGDVSERTDVSSRSRSDAGHVPAWKKKEFHKPSQEEEKDQVDKSDKRERDREKHRRRPSTSESSSSESSSSSSESESSEDEGREGSRSHKPEVIEVKVLTEAEMNAIGAKIVKAELMGNQEQAAKLKAQLEAAREAKKNAPAPPSGTRQKGHDDEEENIVTLTRTDRSGMARPVPDMKHPVESGRKRRKKAKVETHEGKQGERTRYFADDDKYDLKTLVEREKMGTAEDSNQMFARLAGRAAEKTDDDYQMDDMLVSKASQKQSESIEEQRDRAQAIHEHKKMAGALEKCHFCFSKVPKHLIVAIGTKSFLMLPNHKSLTEGHCLIVPMQHIAAGTALDEDVWAEMQVFRKTLTRLYSEQDQDVVFMETSMRLKHFPHMCLECVPMDKEVGDMAPIYFKKALQDSETEWSQNKKVVDLSQKDVRRAIPKGFPYFAVDFGNEGGFAHVIEDEQRFPSYFGREIIGGMIDAEHTLWRKPRQENFDDQRRKVMQFAEIWKPHDWTQNISKHVDKSDSDSD